MHSLASLGTVLAAVSTVSAHGWIDVWTIEGETYTGYNPSIAPWEADQGTIAWPAWNTNLGPVYGSNVTTPDIICSINSTNANKVAVPIAAGATLDLHWTAWADSHHGPIFTYLAACNGECATVDKTELKWFKIAELGQLTLGTEAGYPGTWAADELRANNGSWPVTIPESIKAGNYVIRNEILALHSAYDVGGAQFYPQCANIVITGDGTAEPEGVVGTELYTETDPGVHYNIYNDAPDTVYPLPGPPLYTA
ncbi:glycoside hydrolase [Chaetomium sp. MPI-SDFR-AT-0129]|nr:glycoside hydrolase [Chaetomium sp. MPI-SDFR-AT-0129]